MIWIRSFTPEYIYLGVADMGCILALFALYDPLLGATYFILSPFAAHAIANAYLLWRGKP